MSSIAGSRKVRILAYTTLCAFLIGATSCTGEHPRLGVSRRLPDVWFGMADGYMKAGDYMLFTSEIHLCLDRPGRVKIVDIGFKYVDGELYVDGFAVRPFGWDYPEKK